MNLELSVQLLCLLQFLVVCQSSYERHAKSHLSSIFSPYARLHKQNAVYQRTYAPAYYFNHSAHRRQHKRFPPLFVWRSRHKSLMRHHFTRWTPWSKCNKDCIKRRERFCRTKRKCGKTKYVEEQKCWHCLILRAETPASNPAQNSTVPQIVVVNTAIADSKPQTREMRAHHFKDDFEEVSDFSVNQLKSTDYGAIGGDTFQYEDFDFDVYAEHEEEIDEQYSSQTEQSFHVLMDSKERDNLDTLSLKQRRVYTKWSRWTRCSPKCTTSRFKKCRIREICGRETLREISYCYTEGSFCQQWLRTYIHNQKIVPIEMRPSPQHRRINTSRSEDIASNEHALQTNTILRDVILHGKGYMGPEYMPQKLKCGISPIQQKNQRRRNMINMLKIIGGKAARKGSWPWQVAVFNRFQEAFCGGTLIAPQWVLTAAHCVRKVLYVRLGEHNLDYEDGTELQMRVTRTFKHPRFDKKTVDSDVALLKLPRPVNTTSWIGFSCLPRPYQPLPTNVECTVIGWGKRRNRDVAGTNVLHQAEVPIIPMDNCRMVYQDYTITKNMFCAGHRRGRIDTCAGDSGGPLLCRDINKPNHPWTIFGITSFGDGCAKRNKFGIYTKVSNYVDWVWSVINCNGNCKVQ